MVNTPIIKLSSPLQIQQENHSKIFADLSNLLEIYLNSNSDDPEEVKKHVRLRDWLFITEEGQQIVRIYLDSLSNDTIINDDCLKFHRYLLDKTNFFDIFADGCAIEVSSKGVEPFLRSHLDFQDYVNVYAEVCTWSLPKKLLRGYIAEVTPNKVKFKIEGDFVELDFTEIRYCQALTLHPLAAENPQKQKGAKKKH